jgi:hypothetical protein
MATIRPHDPVTKVDLTTGLFQIRINSKRTNSTALLPGKVHAHWPVFRWSAVGALSNAEDCTRICISPLQTWGLWGQLSEQSVDFRKGVACQPSCSDYSRPQLRSQHIEVHIAAERKAHVPSTIGGSSRLQRTVSTICRSWSRYSHKPHPPGPTSHRLLWLTAGVSYGFASPRWYPRSRTGHVLTALVPPPGRSPSTLRPVTYIRMPRYHLRRRW